MQQVTGTVLYGYFFVYRCVRPVILVPVLPHYAVLWIRNDFSGSGSGYESLYFRIRTYPCYLSIFVIVERKTF